MCRLKMYRLYDYTKLNDIDFHIVKVKKAEQIFIQRFISGLL